MKRKHGVVMLGVLAAAALAPASASAEERTCRGSLGGVTVDNLRVPQGASCTLTGTRVKGTNGTRQRRAGQQGGSVRPAVRRYTAPGA